jgi:dynein heavy chain
VQLALLGEVAMSEDLEIVANGIFDNSVPKMWGTVGFLSLKPLASWVQDLNDRCHFLQDWINNGTPNHFWISGFFFPQAFLTGSLQNFARKKVISIDRVAFSFVLIDTKQVKDITEAAEDGCYVHGMYIEGCKWDYNTHMLGESDPKKLFVELPLLHLLPIIDRETPESGIYLSPVYKVLSRTGTLSTTGHSTNFVMYMELPSLIEQEYWIKAGIAIFLALRY